LSRSVLRTSGSPYDLATARKLAHVLGQASRRDLAQFIAAVQVQPMESFPDRVIGQTRLMNICAPEQIAFQIVNLARRGAHFDGNQRAQFGMAGQDTTNAPFADPA
jgi:hypothetical protein